MINQWFPNVDWEKMWEATRETLYMTGISTLSYIYSWYYTRFTVIFDIKREYVAKLSNK